MADSYKELTTDISNYIAELRKEQPDTMAAFSQIAKSATAEGELDAKTKELVALAIGVAVRCDGCIGFHTKALHRLGATRGELAEILAMSVYMGGGPSLMYAANALKAYDEFKS